MKTALTIAGSDSSGGAGIQADIKTMTANGVYAMSAITALTAQNTTGVTGIFEATPEFLAQEIDAIFTDIYPDAVKIGMVSSAELIGVIAEKLHTYGAKHIVVDPVMVATSGSKLLRDDAVQALTEKLLPMIQHGRKTAGNVGLCAFHRCIQIIALCQIGRNGAGQGAAGAVGIGVCNALAAEPFAAAVPPQKVVGIVDLVAALAQHGTVVFLADPPARWTTCLH